MVKERVVRDQIDYDLHKARAGRLRNEAIAAAARRLARLLGRGKGRPR